MPADWHSLPLLPAATPAPALHERCSVPVPTAPVHQTSWTGRWPAAFAACTSCQMAPDFHPSVSVRVPQDYSDWECVRCHSPHPVSLATDSSHLPGYPHSSYWETTASERYRSDVSSIPVAVEYSLEVGYKGLDSSAHSFEAEHSGLVYSEMASYTAFLLLP